MSAATWSVAPWQARPSAPRRLGASVLALGLTVGGAWVLGHWPGRVATLPHAPTLTVSLLVRVAARVPPTAVTKAATAPTRIQRPGETPLSPSASGPGRVSPEPSSVVSVLPADAASAPQPGAGALRLDGRVLQQAIQAELARDGQKPLLRAELGLQARLSRDMKEAGHPDCLSEDATRHQPAKLGPVEFTGLLKAPWVAAAALRGKCR